MAIKIFFFFQPSLLFQPPSTISFRYFFFNPPPPGPPTIPHLLSIRDLRVHALSAAICNITDESNKLNKKYFCNILRVDLIFSALRKFGYGDKFIHMIKVAYTNVEFKIEINGLLSDPLILVCASGLSTLHAVTQYCGCGTCQFN